MNALAQEIAKPEYAGMTDREIADAINAKTVRIPSLRLIGYGSVMSALGANDGAALLDALEGLAQGSSPVKWALRLLDRGELDVGDPVTREQIDALCAAGVMTAASRDTLKALGEVDGPYAATLGFDRVIDPQDVQEARG
jgi:hypothetical protein